MRKLLLSITLTTLMFSNSFGQCTPQPGLIDDAYGVYPDTVINFPGAVLSSAYYTELNFKAPSDAGEIDPLYTGATINHFTVTSVQGLPPGMTYQCNVANCQYPGGSAGCASISGTCNVEGVYDIIINITANITIPFVTTTDVPESFTGYKIYVNEDGAVTLMENELEQISLYPNPVSDKFTLTGLSSDFGVTSIAIYNMEGKLIQNIDNNNQTNVEVATYTLQNGMYFVNITHNNGTEVLKFIKE